MKRRCKGYLLWMVLFFSLLVSVEVQPVQDKPSVPFEVTRVVWGEDPDNPTKAYPGSTEMPLTVEVQNLSPNETIKGVKAVLVLGNGPFTDIYGNRSTCDQRRLKPDRRNLAKGVLHLNLQSQHR